MTRQSNPGKTVFLLAIIVAMFFMMLLGSCTTEKKFINYGLTHPDIASQFCADEYPAKDSIIKGKTDTIIDTLKTPPVIVPCPEPTVDPETGKTKPASVECPGAYTVYKVVHTTDTIIRVDQAQAKSLYMRLSKETDIRKEKEEELQKANKDVGALRIMLIISVVILFVLLLLILRK